MYVKIINIDVVKSEKGRYKNYILNNRDAILKNPASGVYKRWGICIHIKSFRRKIYFTERYFFIQWHDHTLRKILCDNFIWKILQIHEVTDVRSLSYRVRHYIYLKLWTLSRKYLFCKSVRNDILKNYWIDLIDIWYNYFSYFFKGHKFFFFSINH